MHKSISNWAAVASVLLLTPLLTSCGHHHCNDCGVAHCSSCQPGEPCGEAVDLSALPATTAAPIPVVPLAPVDVKPAEPAPKIAEIKPPPVHEKSKPPEVKPQPVEVKPVAAKSISVERKPIRIRAGSVGEWKDKQGNVWQPDAGFIEGAMVDRGKVAIENTADAELYSTERCCMEKFSWAVPNGKYKLQLHFAETFDDVKKIGERVFSMDVMGEKLLDFDIFKEAPGANKALVKTFHVNATAGKIEIVFTKSEQKEPAINGIEILPE